MDITLLFVGLLLGFFIAIFVIRLGKEILKHKEILKLEEISKLLNNEVIIEEESRVRDLAFEKKYNDLKAWWKNNENEIKNISIDKLDEMFKQWEKQSKHSKM